MRLAISALVVVAVCAPAAEQEKYSGPRPPKPDVPYLMHADTLVETEVAQAKEEERKGETVYTVSGARSPARTPLAEPIFLILAEKIKPESLELYRMEVKGGNRVVVISQKRRGGARPLKLTVTKLADQLFRVEVDEGLGLEDGQYVLSPAGTNDVFCFEEY